MKKPVVVVDLFCGMGGFTQGAIDAGAEVIMSVDAWDEACKVHEANHPGTRIDCIQLGNPDWYKGLLTFLKPYRGNFHIHLHGSPPCQALSNASNRDPSEGMPMVMWFLDLVKSVQPDSWSMENVVPMRKRLPEGTPTTILNSADFGVPQTRRRCYAGVGWLAEPTRTKEEWVSVIEALPHLEGEQLRLEATGSNAKRQADTPLEEPSKTLCGSGNQVGPRVFDHEPEKPVRVRSLTLEETLVLQGFPSDYDLSSARTMKSRWTMVGNAVPPPVAEAVIRGIRQ